VAWVDSAGHDVVPLTTKRNLAKLLIARCIEKLAAHCDQDEKIVNSLEDER
jgi:hypothetical protein